MVSAPSAHTTTSQSLELSDSAETVDPPLDDLHPRKTFHPRKRAHCAFSIFAYLVALCFLCSFAVTSAVAYPTDGAKPFQLSTRTVVLAADAVESTCACKPEKRKHDALFAVEATMIPVLVLLSGILAGLTLGYMSLDETQLNVLAKTGTPKQQYYAKRVIPIRKDGHLLLITLLLGNMIVNETLPVIADGVLGGGVQAVVISTVLVVIFSEIIPQSVCSRFGLAIGSACVLPVRILIYCFFIVSWPVARLLNYILGPHSGVVYRRAELKELIAMHGGDGGHGGDLDRDTITIVGATLDLQTKVVQDAMTPMSKVFQLNINSKLDYETLGKVLKAGHSRIPVFEEKGEGDKKKTHIVGVLLTKQLILLDPEDAVPLRDIPMNALPTVPSDLPLLQILNTFQEGRSHMAIVCRHKPGFHTTSRSASRANASDLSDKEKAEAADSDMEKGEVTGEQSMLRSLFHSKRHKSEAAASADEPKTGVARFTNVSKASLSYSVLDDEIPVGVITLEDVLEELIGEEIYDESDVVGGQLPTLQNFIPPEAVGRLGGVGPPPAPSAAIAAKVPAKTAGGIGLSRLGIKVGRSRSAPGKARTTEGVSSGLDTVAPVATSASILVTPATGGSVTAEPECAEPESLALIAEQTWSDTSDDGEGSKGTPNSLDGSTMVSGGGPLPPRRASDGGSGAAVAPVPGPGPAPGTARAPALLSDAVLLERGRRLLVAQGVDPASLPNLRLAAPRSQPPSRSSTPTPPFQPRVIVPPSVGLPVKRGSFKSPALLAPLPTRASGLSSSVTAASMASTSTPKIESTGSSTILTSADEPAATSSHTAIESSTTAVQQQ